jgi:3-hydroxyacyl-[acyl-carrier-protein] dehydratase
VDRITELESGKRAAAVKNVTMSEDFFAHHFPDHPIMPGALITECLVQLADWLLRENGDFDCVGMPSSFDTIKFHRLVRPGDQLRLEVALLGNDDGQYCFQGHARCDGHVVAAARFTMSLTPAKDLLPAEESKRLFNLIRRD